MHIATITFETFCLQYLAWCLMLKLIILTQVAITERALEYPSAVIPNTSLAFLTNGVHQWTDASMRGEATSSVAYPGFTVIAYGPLKHSICDIILINVCRDKCLTLEHNRNAFTYHHSQSCGEDPGMTHHAVTRLQHALDLAAVRAYRQPLHTLAEVTEGTALLLLIALVAFLWRR